MVDTIIRNFLGQFGSRILNIYLQNSLWINGLILLYSAALLIGRCAFRTILKNFCNAIFPGGFEKKSYSMNAVMKILNQTPQELWEKAMRSTSSIIISKPGSWIIYRKSPQTLQNLIDSTTILEFLSNFKMKKKT